MSDHGNNMLRSLYNKIHGSEQKTRCGRSDLELTDYRRVGNHDYEILVEYTDSRGVPAPSQLNRWVLAEFDGAVSLNMATVRNYAENNVIRCHVREVQTPQLVERSASMLKLGGGRFLDQQKHQWEAQKGPNGESILVRCSDIDVEKILEERINRQRSGRYARVLLSHIRTAGTANLEVGDTVLYGEPSGGGLQQTGVLEKVGPSEVKIRGREGALSRSYVIDIIDKNSSSKAKQNKELGEFFTKYLFSGDKSLGNKLKIK